MKNILLIIMMSILTGCASTQPTKLYSGDQRSLPDVSILTSNADVNVKTIVHDELGIRTSLLGPKLSEAILKKIDDASGESIMPKIGRAFNNSFNGQYSVQVLPGKHDLRLAPNYDLAEHDDYATITINTVAGHEYFVGHIFQVIDVPISEIKEVGISKDKYRWIPVVVDKTAMTLVYPRKENIK